MTVNPGFGGQKYIASMRSKIETVREWIDRDSLAVDLQVDGGITPDTIAHAYQAGANCFVAGTAVFGHASSDPNNKYAKAITALKTRALE